MNTETIKQIIADAPSRASVTCIMYTLRDLLKEAASTICVYDRAELTKSLNKIDELTTALRTLSALDTTIQSLNSHIKAPSSTEPEEDEPEEA